MFVCVELALRIVMKAEVIDAAGFEGSIDRRLRKVLNIIAVQRIVPVSIASAPGSCSTPIVPVHGAAPLPLRRRRSVGLP
jgi:hypothetical protein